MKRFLTMAIVFGASLLASEAPAQQIYKKEPPRGALRYGEKILVDNGKCPKGQLREVTGGVMPSRGARRPTAASTPRERRCVPRPS